jgi:tetratricopeptide (TPR) repeat protein
MGLVFVICCSGSKTKDNFIYNSNSQSVKFVASPEKAPCDGALYCRPDDKISGTDKTWRDLVLEQNHPDLVKAYCLYKNNVYRGLHKTFERFYIFSAGWGIIRSDFMLPAYNITFANAPEWEKRKKDMQWNDFNHLKDDAANFAPGDKIMLLAGSGYIGHFCDMTKSISNKKIIIHKGPDIPESDGFEYRHYETPRRTNWFYEVAENFIQAVDQQRQKRAGAENSKNQSGKNDKEAENGRLKAIIPEWKKRKKALFQNGQTAIKTKNYDDAIDAFSQLIKLIPNTAAADLFYLRGYAYEQKGDLEMAIADYTNACKINPHDPWPYYNRGKVYNRKGEYDKAIEDFSQALSLNPDFTSAYTNRGLAYANKGESDTAIAEYSQAVRIDPECAAAYNYRGNIYKEKGVYDSAISDYTRAIELDPEAKELYPNKAAVYKNRGDAYKAKGDMQKAKEDYEISLELG